ncbi:protein yellow-related [Holotrichia oblita]|uniref:Protein yellow-related n=1 Tax=Holotrichia oblita TaxID=644536 RepID=A0ACB9SM69_HOLOL|nr:protein yellow-related [Holotrichia oblita]
MVAVFSYSSSWRTLAMDNLRVAFHWKQLDFNYPSDDERQEAIRKGVFVPENNLPLGLEVYGDRLFVTVPRWKSGVPASLTYIKLTDEMDSPKLNPYPNWEAHDLPASPGNGTAEIVSPFRIRADRCGRLWVLDTGSAELLGDHKVYSSSQLLIYDLHNDALQRRYEIPQDQVKDNSFFANIAVEDHDCQDTYAYLGDLGAPALVVYSLKENKSWQVNHHYFHIDPLAGDMNVSGINFQWADGVFGLALSAADGDGFSTLYFHPMTSTNEFSVNTRYLRNTTLSKDSFDKFKLLGNRGPNAQSSVSFLDQSSGVLFYALVNLNAIACWKTTNPSYTIQSQGRVYMSNVTMVFPNDIKVDANGNLWALSDKLPTFMYSKLNPDEINFRILTAPVAEAIRGTACDSMLVITDDISNRFNTLNSNSINGNESSSTHTINGVISIIFLSYFLAIFIA